MLVSLPRLVIAGISGDSGKTLLSLALVAGFKKGGKSVAPFKKGPDYIDPAWLSAIAATPCRNLDTFLVPADKVHSSFLKYSQGFDLSLIEGNRGLFDGRNVEGEQSTAELARMTGSPILLVINCAKVTRTVAAIVKGCLEFERGLRFAGVILNRVAGERHKRIITDAIEEYCGIPVLGSIPNLRDKSVTIPERHLGLIPPAEFTTDAQFERNLALLAETHLDLERIYNAARKAKPLEMIPSPVQSTSSSHVRIGYFSDSVFTFYYPENLERLTELGAELVPISSLSEPKLPELDGLYIGGGFPETHAGKLGDNQALMQSVKTAADSGMPIYAECGGLIYLCRNLKWNQNSFPMAGVFDLDLEMHPRPVGHGYTSLEVTADNPYFPVGARINGHEFHYSGIRGALPPDTGCCRMETGVGLGNRKDGLVYRQTLAFYTHIHADGNHGWAKAFISRALDFARTRRELSIPDSIVANGNRRRFENYCLN